jgi:hypothetical protein
LEVPLPKPEAGAEDSFSFLPALLGQKDAKLNRETLVLKSLRYGMFAVRKGRWKWIEAIPETRPAKAGWQPAREELYDLGEDPSEKENVVQSHPGVAQELRASLNAIRNRKHSRPE